MMYEADKGATNEYKKFFVIAVVFASSAFVKALGMRAARLEKLLVLLANLKSIHS